MNFLKSQFNWVTECGSAWQEMGSESPVYQSVPSNGWPFHIQPSELIPPHSNISIGHFCLLWRVLWSFWRLVVPFDPSDKHNLDIRVFTFVLPWWVWTLSIGWTAKAGDAEGLFHDIHLFVHTTVICLAGRDKKESWLYLFKLCGKESSVGEIGEAAAWFACLVMDVTSP